MDKEKDVDIENLKRLLYTGSLSQYGKRKLIEYYEEQQKENEILKSYLSEQGILSDYLKWRKKNKNVKL